MKKNSIEKNSKKIYFQIRVLKKWDQFKDYTEILQFSTTQLGVKKETFEQVITYLERHEGKAPNLIQNKNQKNQIWKFPFHEVCNFFFLFFELFLYRVLIHLKPSIKLTNTHGMHSLSINFLYQS